MKPNLEKRINDVAKELQKGTRTKDIISLFCTKWHLGERTVKLYVSKAREQAKRSIDEANEAAANDSKVQETESRLEALITKSEIIDGLVKIFQNKKTTSDRQIKYQQQSKSAQ
jgi:CHASE3 domain sensor protein